MKKIIAASLVLIASLQGAFAQDVSTVAMGFSAFPRDIKTLGIGGQDAVRNISARTFEAPVIDGNLSYASYAPKSATASKGIVSSLYGKIADKVGIGASFISDQGNEYTVYDETGQSSGTFKPDDMLITGGVSFKFVPFLSIGAGVRYANSKLTSANTISSVGADAFLTWGGDNFVLTAGATNIAGKVKSSDGLEYKVPTAATLAGYYRFALAEKHGLTASAQADYYFVGGVRAAAGAAYDFSDIVFVRVGYNYGGKTFIPSYASVGLGIKFIGINVDAAMLFGSGDINNTLQIGVGYSF